MFTYNNAMYKVRKFDDVNVYEFSKREGSRFIVIFTTVLQQIHPGVADYRQELIDRENQRTMYFHLVPPVRPGESIPKENFPLPPVRIWESDFCDIMQQSLI